MGCATSNRKSASIERDERLSKTFQRNFTVIEKEEATGGDSDLSLEFEAVQRRATISNNILGMVEVMLRVAKNDTEKAHAHLFKADHYFKHAVDLRSSGDMSYFRVFQTALSDYTTACQLDKTNINAIIGLAKTYVKLHQHRKALDHLHGAYKRRKDELSKLAEFWYLYGLCYRKCAKVWNSKTTIKRDRNGLENARECLRQGITIEPQNAQIIEESKTVEKLIDVQSEHKMDFGNYIEKMKQTAAFDDATVSQSRKDKETYKILSLDGGGFKGIIPAMVLCEIEKRCHRRLTDIFDMFAGTSAGAFITFCLTASQNVDSLVPLYTAAHPLEILIRKADRISPSPSNIRRLYSEKYSNKKGCEVSHETFMNLHLSQTLGHVMIPTVNYDGPLRTVYFTNYDAKESKDKDFLIKDIVMASTAAPSFYPPYLIPGMGYFLDGGLTMANPCKKAYEEAVYRFNKDPKDVYAVSLSTGVNVNPVPEENQSRGLLFWASKTPHYMITSQSHDTDTFMRTKLDNRYKRFGLYYEDEISMDSYTHVPDLIEIGTQYIEEKNDKINQTVEMLLNN